MRVVNKGAIGRFHNAVALSVGVACAGLLGLLAAPSALAVGDWTYLFSGSPSSAPSLEIQITWNEVSPGTRRNTRYSRYPFRSTQTAFGARLRTATTRV